MALLKQLKGKLRRVFLCLGLSACLIAAGNLLMSDTDALGRQKEALGALCDQEAAVRNSQDYGVCSDCSDPGRLPTFLTTPQCLQRFRQSHSAAARRCHAIPAIRHVLWKDEMISKYMAQHLLSWTRLHPNWTYILWRDSDIRPFIEKHFPGKLLQQVDALKNDKSIKLIDLVRYAILHKFGGVYADLDIKLISDIDEFRSLPAVIIREPELHSVHIFGLLWWPPKPLLMNSLMMSMPGHSFMDFCISQLSYQNTEVPLQEFAGPTALTKLAEKYNSIFPVASCAAQTVYVPPSYSFNGYPGNSLSSAEQTLVGERLRIVTRHCRSWRRVRSPSVEAFCGNPANLNLITDSSHRVYAMHDYNKSDSAHFFKKTVKEFEVDKVNVKQLIPGIKMASELY